MLDVKCWNTLTSLYRQNEEHDQNRFTAVNHYALFRNIRYDYMHILTWTILKETRMYMYNCCETFAFKYNTNSVLFGVGVLCRFLVLPRLLFPSFSRLITFVV